MCTAYQTFGAVGLITNGAGRDLDQVHAIGFPTFTNGTICAHAYSHILHVHVPVHVGGLAIYPDDLLHGDLNGVTTIPNEIATELAEIGDEFVAAERIIMDALHSETPSLKAYQEAVGEASECIAALRRRVTRAR
jgi:regulator of RNase E activity RraA